jgi:uncharacterized coiled-coil DUF342 family protein
MNAEEELVHLRARNSFLERENSELKAEIDGCKNEFSKLRRERWELEERHDSVEYELQKLKRTLAEKEAVPRPRPGSSMTSSSSVKLKKEPIVIDLFGSPVPVRFFRL